MQISIETTSGLERRLTISVPSETFEQQISQRLGETAGRMRLPGFRPGKVPMKEVRRRYGQAVRAEVAGELMQSSFFDAVRQEELAPASQPNLEVVKMEPGNDLEFTATFEVFPAVELSDLGKVAVQRPEAEITDTDLDAMIEQLRDRRKEWLAVDRGAQEGDRVTLDFEGRLDGEVFEGGSGEDGDLVVGSGQMIDDFEAGVCGLRAGEESEFEATFPDNYRAEHLAGKTVTFTVKVKSVTEPRLPDMDEAFFKGFGIEEGGLEALRADVRKNMQREMDAAVLKVLKSQVMDQLKALHTIQLPVSLVNSEIATLRQQMSQQFQMYGSQDGQPDLPDELFREQAERRVTVGLVVNEIVTSAGLEASPAKVRERIEVLAEGYSEPQQVVSWYYSNQEQLQQIEMAVLEDEVVNQVLGQAQVEVVASSYQDIISGQAITQPDDGVDVAGADAGADAGPAEADPAEADPAQTQHNS